MQITEELEAFINAVADVATRPPHPPVTREECIAEYTDQIRSDDNVYVVLYAQDMGIEIPAKLQGVLMKVEEETV